MENENNLVRVESESGEFLDMLILKEFDYKKKHYAVLMEMDSCKCSDKCECEECDCDVECKCDDECDCGCQEEKECSCHKDCDCEEEKALCILEITKDKDDNEVFVSIDDEKLYDEIIEEADRILYEE